MPPPAEDEAVEGAGQALGGPPCPGEAPGAAAARGPQRGLSSVEAEDVRGLLIKPVERTHFDSRLHAGIPSILCGVQSFSCSASGISAWAPIQRKKLAIRSLAPPALKSIPAGTPATPRKGPLASGTPRARARGPRRRAVRDAARGTAEARHLAHPSAARASSPEGLRPRAACPPHPVSPRHEPAGPNLPRQADELSIFHE